MIPRPNAADQCSKAYGSSECDLMSVKIEYSHSCVCVAVDCAGA